MARFFIDRPIVAMVISIVTVLLGVVAMQRPADRAVPRDRAADGPGDDDVRRRERDRRRGLGGDAGGAEDQRRRELDLHEVDQRQRRHADAEGELRGRLEPRHGERPHAEQAVRGDAAAAGVGQDLRRRGEEGAGVPADGHLAQVAERDATTTTSCRTTRRSTSTTTSPASRASARSTCSAAATTRCASGCGPTGSRGSASRCPTSSNAISQQNTLSPVGPDRRPAGGARHRVHLHGPHAGAPAERRGVRRDHRPLEPRRLAGQA